MPSLRVHVYVDRKLFGKAYYKVHRGIDSAYPYFGGQHRRFGHDHLTAIAIAREAYPGDPNAVNAALMHLDLDRMCSADPSLRLYLETLAEAGSKRKHPRRKKGKKPVSPELRDFISSLKKIDEYRYLYSRFKR